MLEVTLQCDGADLSNEVRAILGSLTEEQKREMAADLLRKTLLNMENRVSRTAAIAVALEKINEKHPLSKGRNDAPVRYIYGPGARDYDREEKLRTSHDSYVDDSVKAEFNKLVEEMSNVQSFFLSDVLRELKNISVAKIHEALTDNRVIQKLIADGIQAVVESIPMMAQTVLQHWFMESIRSAFQQGAMPQASSMLESTVKKIGESLKARL